MDLHRTNANHGKKPLLWVISCLILVFFCAQLAAQIPGTDFTPGPLSGDVYREYMYVAKNPKTGFDTYISGAYWFTRSFELEFHDLDKAVKAEMCFEFWGGHAGTSDKRFVVNGNEDKPVYFPLPLNTPTRPECYLTNMNGNSSAVLPLELLKKDGKNKFEIFSGPQICHSWNHPAFWAYAAFIRIYYDPAKMPHPQGKITSPASGAVVDDNPEFAATAQSKDGIQSVYFIGFYEDNDWEGNGKYRQWHYQTHKGVMKYHMGTKTTAPYQVTWDTKKIPDQPLPMKFMARIQDRKGIYYMTEAVTKIRLKRTKRSVKLGKPFDVPEIFWVGSGLTKTCKIRLPENVHEADGATLIVPTWGAYHASEEGTIVKLNNSKVRQKFGRWHHFSYDQFPVSQGILKTGAKEALFSVYSTTTHHPTEVVWPGPTLLISFPSPDTTYCDTCDKPDSTVCDTCDTTVCDTCEGEPGVSSPNTRHYIPFLNLSCNTDRSTLLLEYQIPNRAHVDLRILTVQGKTVRRIENLFRTPGSYRRSIRISALPAGVYLVRLVVQDSGTRNIRAEKLVLF